MDEDGSLQLILRLPKVLLAALLAMLVLASSESARGQGAQAPAVGGLGAGAGLGGGFGTGLVSVGGYIDGAIPMNRLRIRFDAADDNPNPDRAEFFYPQLGGTGGDGPALAETGVDYQEAEAYYEISMSPCFSAFVEVPFRLINPEVNDNHAGLSDIRAGIKYALFSGDDYWTTFQLRGYFPTGDGNAGLGTDHTSIEPGLLFQYGCQPLSLFGEFKAWVPLGSSVRGPGNLFSGREFSGTVMRYGLGAGYDVHETCCGCDTVRSTLVTEVVGWTILDGLKSNVDQTESAVNDTIVNLKIGLRLSRSTTSFYVGYGRALTGDVWYQDIVRAEYEMRF